MPEGSESWMTPLNQDSWQAFEQEKSDDTSVKSEAVRRKPCTVPSTVDDPMLQISRLIGR
jgi:hypothetical protein